MIYLFISSRNGGEEVWRRKKKINWFLNIWHIRNDKINIKMIALKKLSTKMYQPPLPFQNDPPLNHTFILFYNCQIPSLWREQIKWTPPLIKKRVQTREVGSNNLLKMGVYQKGGLEISKGVGFTFCLIFFWYATSIFPIQPLSK